jgi:hypothetical protein
VHPYWADKLNYIGPIGAHRFYRFGGPAGASATFRFAYRGREPLPEPRPHAALRPRRIRCPIRSRSSAPMWAGGAGQHLSAGSPPVYSADLQRRGDDRLYRADNLPHATEIRPESQHSGHWIAQPE